MRALKALAALLSYPREDLVEALPEIREAIASERRIGRRERSALEALAGEIAAADLLEAQEGYVAMFDRGRATSLNLYEHVHGDSRDRGQAMVDLVRIYEKGGLVLESSELPDYLPVLLEYLSTRPFEEIREMLRDCAHLLRSIGEALARRGSPYAAVPHALLAIAGEETFDLAVPARPAPVEDERALDEEWAEAPVLFGAGCATQGHEARASAPQPIRFVRKVA